MKRITVIDSHTAGEPTRVVIAGGPELGSGALMAADGKLILLDKGDLSSIEASPTGYKLPAQTIHGRSFAPQLLGKPGHPREWIHIQNAGDRQVRNSDYMLDNKNQLRRVVQLWEEPAKPNENKATEKEAAARKSLQAVFDALGK